MSNQQLTLRDDRFASRTREGKPLELPACECSASTGESAWPTETERDQMVEIMARGGGVGVNISSIRPRGSYIKTVNGQASGPISWAELYSVATGEVVAQGGTRRGACLLLLEVWHPDIEEFITAKRKTGKLKYANISVGISDAFMKAVQNDADWDLTWQGQIAKTVKARYLWNLIAESAHESGEPGLIFLDRVNQQSSTGYLQKLVCASHCQPGFATVLTPDGIRTFDEIDVGSTIWSGKRWTKVVRKVATGIRPVYAYRTTCGTFVGTTDHKVFSNSQRIVVDEAKTIDVCLGPRLELGNLDPQDVMDGLVIGDGSVHKASHNLVHLHVGTKDNDYYQSEVASLLSRFRPALSSMGSAWEINTSITAGELPRTFDRIVPERFYRGTPKQMAGFLRGLFSANGSVVQGNGYSRVGLKQTSHRLVCQVQEMLSSLGIRSYITTNKPSPTVHRNGTYTSKQSYDLNISTDKDRFVETIGFLQDYKNESIHHSKPSLSTKSSPVQSVTHLGDHLVYDITVEAEEHSYWTGGLLVSNCGEPTR